MQTANFGNLFRGQGSIVDKPAGGRMGHKRLDHVYSPVQIIRAAPAGRPSLENHLMQLAEPGKFKHILYCFCTRSDEHTSELQSLMRISYAVFCLKKKKTKKYENHTNKYHNN